MNQKVRGNGNEHSEPQSEQHIAWQIISKKADPKDRNKLFISRRRESGRCDITVCFQHLRKPVKQPRILPEEIPEPHHLFNIMKDKDTLSYSHTLRFPPGYYDLMLRFFKEMRDRNKLKNQTREES